MQSSCTFVCAFWLLHLNVRVKAVAAEAILKWGATSRAEGRGIETPKAPRGVPSLLGEGSGKGQCRLPENFEFSDLQMVCFGVFSGAKFNISVTTKSCKYHTLNVWGTTADATKRNKHLSFFLTLLMNTNQLNPYNPVSPSVTCLRDCNPLRIRYCNILSQKQTQFFQFSFIMTKNLN